MGLNAPLDCEMLSTDAQINLYLSHGRLSIDAECIGLGARTYKNHCAPVLKDWLRVLSDQVLSASSRRLPAEASEPHTVPLGTNNKVKMGSDSRPTGSASDPQ